MNTVSTRHLIILLALEGWVFLDDFLGLTHITALGWSEWDVAVVVASRVATPKSESKSSHFTGKCGDFDANLRS